MTRFLGARQPAGTAEMGRAPLVGWASGVSFICVVATVTLAIRAHELSLAPFISSAGKIAAGEIWLLPASALVVDRPVDLGLVAFCLLGLVALRICGASVFWVAAAVGHLGSTLAVYAIIGASRLADPDVFARALVSQDYGVSAMQGAWVGAIAATAWSRARADRRARAVVAAGVCAIAGFAWLLHPDPSILTTEHLFAFLIGWGVVSQPLAASARAVARLLFSWPLPTSPTHSRRPSAAGQHSPADAARRADTPVAPETIVESFRRRVAVARFRRASEPHRHPRAR